jgi:Uma2 family endonuclease
VTPHASLEAMSTAPILWEKSRLIKRVEYEKMIAVGVFGDERVELLYGVIVEMPPKGPPHDSAIQRLTKRLVAAIGERADVRVQSAFAASDGSEPEPDVAIVPTGSYREAHPDQALLVIEVADSSLAIDRGTKAQLYAESGVPEYWVVNVRDAIIEVHTDIVRGAYTHVKPYRAGDHVALVSFPDIELAVADVL